MIFIFQDIHCLNVELNINSVYYTYCTCRLQPGQVVFHYHYYFNSLYKSEG
mgnify:CR=1 FL=1